MEAIKLLIHYLFGGMALPAPFIALTLAFSKPEVAIAYALYGLACAAISYVAYGTKDSCKL